MITFADITSHGTDRGPNRRRLLLGLLVGIAALASCRFSASDVPGSFADSMAASVNVKRFGAKGDGVSDDTRAIRAAISHLKRLGADSKTLFFPSGNYAVKGTLDFSDPVDAARNSSWLVHGESNANIILKADIAEGAVINFYTGNAGMARNNRIKGISIYTESGGAKAKYGIDFRNNTQYSIEDIRIIRTFSDIGLFLSHSYNGLVANTEISADRARDYAAISSLKRGVLCYVGNQSNALTFVGCNFQGSSAPGVVGCEIQGAVYGVTFKGTSFQSCTVDGLRISNTQAANINVDSCYFEGNSNQWGSGKDINLTASGYCSGITFTNCFLNSDDYGLYVDAGAWIGVAVRQCLFDNFEGKSVFRNPQAVMADWVFDRNIHKDQGYAALPLNILPASPNGRMEMGKVYNCSVSGVSGFSGQPYGTVEYPGLNPANLIDQDCAIWKSIAGTVAAIPAGAKFGHPVTRFYGTNASEGIAFDIPASGLEGKIITFAVWMRRSAGDFDPHIRIAQNGVENDRTTDFTRPTAYRAGEWNLWVCYYPVHPTSQQDISIRILCSNAATVEVAMPVARVGMLGVSDLAASTSRSPLSGRGRPSVAPSFIGQDYLDIANAKWYKAKGLSADDWLLLN